MSPKRDKLVICAPMWPQDIATTVWAPYLTKAVKRIVESHGIEPVVLSADDCTRQKFWEALQDTSVRGVTGVGHGSETVFTGQRYDALLTVKDDPPPGLKHGAFFPVSCLVGAALCPTLVEKGVPAAIGNVTEYWFTSEKVSQTGEDLDEDRLLRFFLRCEYKVLLPLLLAGYPIGYAWREMRTAYEQAAKEAVAIDSLTAWCLRYDGRNRLLFGNEEWVLPTGVKKTKVVAGAEGERDPFRRLDVISVFGKVEDEEGEPAKGYVDVVVVCGNEESRERVELEDGCFSISIPFELKDNTRREYSVTVIYPGWREDGVLLYSPSCARLSVAVEPVGFDSELLLESVKATQSDLMAEFTITGYLTDTKGTPLPDRDVYVYIVAVGYGYEVTASARTDKRGRFVVKTSLPGEMMKKVDYRVRVWFPGDQWFKSSLAETQVSLFFLPKVPWWVVLVAAALLATLIYMFTRL